jgi:hypothetical protein
LLLWFEQKQKQKRNAGVLTVTEVFNWSPAANSSNGRLSAPQRTMKPCAAPVEMTVSGGGREQTTAKQFLPFGKFRVRMTIVVSVFG